MTRAATKNRHPGEGQDLDPASQPDAAGVAPLTLPAGAFTTVVGKAVAVVERRNTIPIIGCVLLRARDGRIEVSGTNLDQVVTASLEAPAAAALHVAVPGHDLKAALDRLDQKGELTIALDADGQRLSLRQGRTAYRFPVLPAEDWPEVDMMPEGAARFVITAAELAAGLDGVSVAASSEEVRYWLNGVFLDFTAGDAAFVATDGHRLHRCSMPPGLDSGHAPAAIVPTAAIRPLVTACDGGGDIAIILTSTKLRAEAPNAKGAPVVLTTKLVDGSFPDWRRVVPRGDAPNACAAEAAALLAALERVAVIVDTAISSENSKKLTAGVRLAIGDGEIVITNAGRDGRQATSACPASLLRGEAGEIGFNAPYLIAALRSLGDADTVQIAWTDAAAPILITIQADPQMRQQRVVMPMRV